MKTHILWLAASVSLAGCGNSDPDIKIEIPPLEVPTGTEVQNCYYMKSTNDVPLEIGHVSIQFAPGTHHVHLYYSDTPHDDGQESCFQAVDFDTWRLFAGSQRASLDWELPDGVALRLEAHQQLLVQVHYVNAGKLTVADGTGSGTFSLYARSPDAVQTHMGSIFGQQRNIDIPPMSSFSVDGICQTPPNVHLGAFAGHYHFRGRDFTGALTDPTGTAKNVFYTTSNFNEPVFDTYSLTNAVAIGASDRLLWHCDYDNPTAEEVLFGPREVDQEHCNMFAFYYPAGRAQEFLPCVSFDRCSEPCGDEVCSEAGTCVPR
jgi:hypothetical protein